MNLETGVKDNIHRCDRQDHNMLLERSRGGKSCLRHVEYWLIAGLLQGALWGDRNSTEVGLTRCKQVVSMASAQRQNLNLGLHRKLPKDME